MGSADLKEAFTEEGNFGRKEGVVIIIVSPCVYVMLLSMRSRAQPQLGAHKEGVLSWDKGL